jgi:hypothetical protein
MRTRYAKAQKTGPSGMNKTEAQYHQILTARERTKEISDVRFEGITLKLGHDVRYTPDFVCVGPDGVLECHEVKAGKAKKSVVGGKLKIKADANMTPDGRVRLHVAAEMFPFRFVLATLTPVGFITEEVRV